MEQDKKITIVVDSKEYVGLYNMASELRSYADSMRSLYDNIIKAYGYQNSAYKIVFSESEWGDLVDACVLIRRKRESGDFLAHHPSKVEVVKDVATRVIDHYRADNDVVSF